MKTIILFAHGARDPEWARPLERLAAEVKARDPERAVRLAFLEFMTPSLGEAIDEAALAGSCEVAVVPVFLAQGGHVKRDMPLIIDAAQRRHPELALSLRPALGEMDVVIAAMAGAVIQG